MSTAPVVSRFAPSPTGYLHVGSARTALFCWLLARNKGGHYLLRIEDTDLARSTEKAVVQVLEDLRWLGLNHDNKELVFQSKRTAVYNRIIDDLIARGLAYEAYDTPAELDAMRKDAERNKRQFVYRKREASPEQIAQWKSEGRKSVVRFSMLVKEYRFYDVVAAKDIVLPPEEAQDFVIRKTDGMPTYHFAVVVDDAEAGVTHILRGQEHTKNTFLHIALQEALNYPRPTYVHLSVIENLGGGKMSKRDRDKKVREAVNNFIKNTKKPLAEIATAAELDVARVTEWLGNTKTQLDPSEHEQLMPIINLKARRPARNPRARLPQEWLPARGAAELPRAARLEPRREPRDPDDRRDDPAVLDRAHQQRRREVRPRKTSRVQYADRRADVERPARRSLPRIPRGQSRVAAERGDRRTARASVGDEERFPHAAGGR
jgi:tryptophanyl-tRNA synthetase